MSDRWVRVYYGGKPVDCALPAGWNLLAVAEPREVPEMEDVGAAVRGLLAKPMGMPPLADVLRGLPHTRTVIISDDADRTTPVGQVLMPLLAWLNEQGIGDEAIDVVIGRGTHRAPDPEEIRAKLGAEAKRRLRVSIHDPDAADLVYVGTTHGGTAVHINHLVAEAALVIAIGSANVHYFAGYGGGAKLILPGVSGRATIRQNHVLIRDRHAYAGITVGNPLWEDMLEAARLTNLHFTFNAILNTRQQICRLCGGEVEAQQQAAIAHIKEIYGVPVPGRADVTIASAYPLETNLIQSGKAITTADAVTKPGGTIILLSACPNGAGPLFYETLSQKPTPEEIIEWVRTGRASTTSGTMASRLRGVLQTKRLIVVTEGLKPEELRAMDMAPAPSLSAALAAAQAEKASQDVIVLPVGGSTFPYVGEARPA